MQGGGAETTAGVMAPLCALLASPTPNAGHRVTCVRSFAALLQIVSAMLLVRNNARTGRGPQLRRTMDAMTPWIAFPAFPTPTAPRQKRVLEETLVSDEMP